MEKREGLKCHPGDLGFASFGLKHYASATSVGPFLAGRVPFVKEERGFGAQLWTIHLKKSCASY